MRAFLIALAALAACQGPDRWNMGVSRGDGTLDGHKGDYELEDTRLEVGVSGPIFAVHERRAPEWGPPERCPPPTAAPALAAATPADSSGLPWLELVLLAGGALGYKGGEIGVRRYRSRKKRA